MKETGSENGYIHVDEMTLRTIDEKMPPQEELQDLAEFFKVFGDGTRLKILYVLLSAEMCVYDIAAVLGVSQSSNSHQLRGLQQMDLGENRREGKTIFYSLGGAPIVTILIPGLDVIAEGRGLGGGAEAVRETAQRPLPPRRLHRCCFRCRSDTWCLPRRRAGNTQTVRSY